MNADGLMAYRSKEDQSISSLKGAQGDSPGQSVAPPWDSLRYDDRHGQTLPIPACGRIQVRFDNASLGNRIVLFDVRSKVP